MNASVLFRRLFPVFALTALPASALGPGDIAFVGFSTVGSDSLGFVALVEIPAGEVIYFTDNSWDGFAFNTTEGVLTWTAPGLALSAGTVVTLDSLDGIPSASAGTLVESDGNFNISSSGDDIYAYQGTSETEPTSFLALIANTDTSYDLSNTGLDDSAGTALVFFDGVDWMAYMGPRDDKASFAEYLPEIANIDGILGDPFSTGNWMHADSFELGIGEGYDDYYDETSFSIAGDSEAPQIVSRNPDIGGTEAGIVQNLTITFDEGIRLGVAGSLTIRKLADGTLVESIPVTNFFQLEVTGNQLSINPSVSLEFSTSYYVELDKGFVADSSGNLFAGFIGSSEWRFTTADAPIVVISQYYEGDNLDKYLELHNVTGSDLDLTDYVLTLWSNSNNQGWRLGGTPDQTLELAGATIPPGGYFLVGHPNVASPEHGVLNVDLLDSVGNVLNFNGNDSVVLYLDGDQNAVYEAGEIVDALAFTSSDEGLNTSFYRVSNDRGYTNTLGDSILSFPEVWTVATIAQVGAAAEGAPEYLGSSKDFNAWLQFYAAELGGQLGFDDDPDDDGTSTGAEWYYYGSHPGIADHHGAPLQAAGAAGGGFSFSHRRREDRRGAIETYQWATSPAGPWSDSGAESGGLTVSLVPGVPVPSGLGYEEVVVSVEVSGGDPPPALFARLSLEEDL